LVTKQEDSPSVLKSNEVKRTRLYQARSRSENNKITVKVRPNDDAVEQKETISEAPLRSQQPLSSLSSPTKMHYDPQKLELALQNRLAILDRILGPEQEDTTPVYSSRPPRYESTPQKKGMGIREKMSKKIEELVLELLIKEELLERLSPKEASLEIQSNHYKVDRGLGQFSSEDLSMLPKPAPEATFPKPAPEVSVRASCSVEFRLVDVANKDDPCFA
jgi:hypothetical protein